MRAHALLGLHHGAVELLGQDDVAVKQTRAVLVGNAQRIPKTACGDQERRLALALQQRIGGHGGAHLHAFHQRGGDGRGCWQAQQVAHTRHGGITVVLGVFAQQLVRDQGAVGALGHDIGKGATAVDPELPAGICMRVHSDAAERAAWS